MKKFLLTLALAAMTLSSAFAATADELRAGVQWWAQSAAHTGTTASAVVVINCSDGANLVCGYQWNGDAINVMDAVDDIIAANDNFTATKCSNDTYYGSITYGEHTAAFASGLGTKVNDALKFNSQSSIAIINNDVVVLSYDDFGVPSLSALSNLIYIEAPAGEPVVEEPVADPFAVALANAVWNFNEGDPTAPSLSSENFPVPANCFDATGGSARTPSSAYLPYIKPGLLQDQTESFGLNGDKYALYFGTANNAASRLPAFMMFPTISDAAYSNLELQLYARQENATTQRLKIGYIANMEGIDMDTHKFSGTISHVATLELTATYSLQTVDLATVPNGAYVVLYCDITDAAAEYFYIDNISFATKQTTPEEPSTPTLTGKSVTLAEAIWDFSQEMTTADNGYGYQIPANMIADNTTDEADSYVARILPGNETTTYGYNSTKALQVRAGRYYPTSYVILPKISDVENYDSLQLSFYARCGYQQGEQHKYGQSSYGHSVKVGHLSDVCAPADFSTNIVNDTTLELPTSVNENQGVDSDNNRYWRHFSVPMKDCEDYMVLYLENIGNAYIYFDSIVIEKIPAEVEVPAAKTITYNLVGCTPGTDEDDNENPTEIGAEDTDFYFYFNLEEGRTWDGVEISVMMGENALEDAMQTWNFDEGYLWEADGNEAVLNVWVSDEFTDDLTISITCAESLAFPAEFTPATFEGVTVGDNGVYYNPDLKWGANAWIDGSFMFYTFYDNSYGSDYYSDIVVSSLVDPTLSADYNNPVSYLSAAVNHAAQGQNFSVWNQNFYGISPVKLGAAQVVSGMAVTNTSAVVNYIFNTYTAFGQGDWFKLIVTGKKDGNVTGTADFYLVDFRTERNWKYAENWQWMDLSTLGEVDELEFNVDGSDKNEWGLLSPAYFCFDNLGGQAADCQLGAMSVVPVELPTYNVVYNLIGCIADAENVATINEDSTSLSLDFTLEEGYTWAGAEISIMLGDEAITADYEEDNWYYWTPSSGNLYIYAQDGFTADVTVTLTALVAQTRPTVFAAATFDELEISANGVYRPESFVVGNNEWLSGSFVFNTSVQDWGDYGIGYTDVQVANFANGSMSDDFSDAYLATAAQAAANGSNYAVWNDAYGANAQIEVCVAGVVSGMAVTNIKHTVTAITEGMAPARKFEQNDWLKITATGWKDGETTGETEFYLADFRSETEWVYAENWQWMDLSSLGTVDHISFSISSSDNGDWGMNTPAYFCFDNLGGQASDCQLGEMTVIKLVEDALEEIDATNVEKFFENGQIFIKKAGKIYNAAGMLVK